MNVEVEQLIRNLREELTEYGELLALLEKQQELIVTGSAAGLIENLSAINGQVPIVAAVRTRRDNARKQLAEALNQPGNLALRKLIEMISPEYGPLIAALVDEVNESLARSQERLRQNHSILSRSLNQMQKVIFNLFPTTVGQTYRGTARVNSPEPVPSTLCEAIV